MSEQRFPSGTDIRLPRRTSPAGQTAAGEQPLRGHCNPASAGGRGRKRLPLATSELDRLGVDHHVVETRDIEHAREAARDAAAAGETVIAIGGDGLLRPSRPSCAAPTRRWRSCPAGAGNDLARVLEIPTDTAAATRIAVEGREWLMDMATVDGEPYLGIASFGFDSDANRIANEARLVRGNLVYLYAALRALVAWKPARFTLTVDGERHEIAGYSVGVANSRPTAAGCTSRPRPSSTTGCSTWWRSGTSRSCASCSACCRRSSRATHLDEPYVHAWRGEVDRGGRRPRRSTIYADGDPIGAAAGADRGRAALPARDRPALMFALWRRWPALVRALTPPARPRRRHHAARAGCCCASARTRSSGWAPSSTTARRWCRRPTARRPPRRWSRRSSSASGEQVVHNRAGLEHGLGRGDGAARRAPRPGQLGLFEVDEAWLPAGRATRCTRAPTCSSNLFRDQLDRYGELELLADGWAEPGRGAGRPRALRAQRRRPAGRRPRPRAARASSTSASRTTPRRSPSSSTPPTPSTAATAARRTSTTPSTSAISAATAAPTAAATRPEPTVVATRRRRSTGMARRRRDARARRRGRSTCRLPLPGLYNVYNAVGGRGAGARPRRLAGPTSRQALEGVRRRVRPRRDDPRAHPAGGERPVSILLVKNPAGANEVLRTLTLEDEPIDLWMALNDNIADGRDVSWIWDADFELLAGRVRRATCSGTRAEEMALRLEVRRDRGRARAV